MSIEQWPDVLRAAGLQVYERPNWKNNKPLGSLQGLRVIYWHHDASPIGDSPGAWNWICSSYDNKQPSAQLWMDMRGKWYFVGAGVAYHAGSGRVAGDWNRTVGLETDHTNNEVYPAAMMNSIHRGFAAICKHERRNADLITFHKIEAVPRGRKVDPYLRTDGGSANDQSTWDKELADNRAAIQSIINGGIPTTPTGSDELSAAEVDQIITAVNGNVSDARFDGVLTDVVNRLYILEQNDTRQLLTDRFNEVLTDVVNRLYIIETKVNTLLETNSE